MIPEYVIEKKLDRLIDDAIAEDMGDGDHSTLAVIPDTATGEAALIAKEEGIIAGLELSNRIFHKYDRSLGIVFNFKDGDKVSRGDIVLFVRGKVRSILSTERLVLNFMQRMSGIATRTGALAEKIRYTKTKLLDTRKTTPGLRMLEKWAVFIGGGINHRMGLYDMIMLKDNHIDAVGGIKKALEAAYHYLNTHDKKMKIEIETRNLNEVKEVLEAGGCDIIMLDNMSPEEMAEAVLLINGKYITEASGNITDKNILEVARSGVDFISVGALTHSVKSLDLSLKIKQ